MKGNIPGPRAGMRAPQNLEVGAWLRMMKAHNLILQRARRSVTGHCTLPQFDVLAHLFRHDEGLSPAELSRRLLVTAGNVTGLVDRMERMGWVRRVKDAQDRRASVVRLTKAGRAVASRLIPRHTADIEGFFSVLNNRETKQLRHLLDKLIQRLDGEETTQIQGGKT